MLLLKNIYSKSNCFIKLCSEETKPFQYSRGVRQGCILSPLLSNLFLNDLPKSSSTAHQTDPFILSINDDKLTSLLYADDLVQLSKSGKGLQNCIDIVSSFCESWHLTVNHKKSTVLIFSRKTSENFLYKPLEIVQDFTYLGVKFHLQETFKIIES